VQVVILGIIGNFTKSRNAVEILKNECRLLAKQRLMIPAAFELQAISCVPEEKRSTKLKKLPYRLKFLPKVF